MAMVAVVPMMPVVAVRVMVAIVAAMMAMVIVVSPVHRPGVVAVTEGGVSIVTPAGDDRHAGERENRENPSSHCCCPFCRTLPPSETRLARCSFHGSGGAGGPLAEQTRLTS